MQFGSPQDVSVLAVLAELVVFALLVMLDCWCKCIASVLAIGRARQDKTVPCIPTSPTSPPTNWTFCSPDLQSTIAYGIHIMDTGGFMYNVYMNYLLLQNPNVV